MIFVKELANRPDKIDLDSLDFIETILVYKLLHFNLQQQESYLSYLAKS